MNSPGCASLSAFSNDVKAAGWSPVASSNKACKANVSICKRVWCMPETYSPNWLNNLAALSWLEGVFCASQTLIRVKCGAMNPIMGVKGGTLLRFSTYWLAAGRCPCISASSACNARATGNWVELPVSNKKAIVAEVTSRALASLP